MSDNLPPVRAEVAGPPPNAPDQSLTGQQAYNLVTDTVAGPNVRLSDNLLQAAAIGICLLLGTGIGAAVAAFTAGGPIKGDHLAVGAIVGGFAGLLIGLFTSGIFIMVYRAVMHVRDEHD
jgi:hypothetical protein